MRAFTSGSIIEPPRERLRFQLAGELAEFVEIDTRSEPERMRYRLRRRIRTVRRSSAKTGANGPVYRLLEWYAEFARPELQEPRKIVIERQGRAHREDRRCAGA